MKEPFKLKPLRSGSSYPTDRCAALKCSRECDVIDGTKTFWKVLVPLCSKHFEAKPVPVRLEAEKPPAAQEVKPAVSQVEAAPVTVEVPPVVENQPVSLPVKHKKQKLESYRLF